MACRKSQASKDSASICSHAFFMISEARGLPRLGAHSMAFLWYHSRSAAGTPDLQTLSQATELRRHNLPSAGDSVDLPHAFPTDPYSWSIEPRMQRSRSAPGIISSPGVRRPFWVPVHSFLKLFFPHAVCGFPSGDALPLPCR